MAIVLVLALVAIQGGFKFSFFDSAKENGFLQIVEPVPNGLKDAYYGQYSTKSGTAKIGDYEFTTSVVDTRSGQAFPCNPLSATNQGCYIHTKITKNGILVKDLDNCAASISRGDSENWLTGFNAKVDDTLSVRSKGLATYGGYCQFGGAIYTFAIPKDAINVSMSAPKDQYFQGQDVTVKVIIDNNWMDTYGLLTVGFSTPTIFGDKTASNKTLVHLAKGHNEFSYKIPTNIATSKITAIPSIEIVYPSSSVSGLNADTDPNDAYGWLDIGGSMFKTTTGRDYISLGQTIEKSFNVMIIPRPMFVKPNADGSCDSGYSKNADGSYCIDDLSKLPCYVTAPPVVEGHDYVCSSYGIWTEVVYQVKTVYKTIWGTCPDTADTITNPDNSTYCVARCPDGTSTTTAADGSRICIKTEVAEKILGCTASTTPPAICKGMTASCVNNEWVFDGKCEVITETQTKEVVREVIVEKPVDRIVNTTTNEIPTWIYIALAGMVVTILVLMLKKKRR